MNSSMSARPLKLFVSCLLAFVVITGLAYFIRTDAADLHARALGDADVSEDVVIEGEQYEVRGGVVRNLQGDVDEKRRALALGIAYAAAATRSSPLYALPGVDVSSLEKTTGDLEALREQYALMRGDSEASRLIRSGLYPIDYLRALVQLERLRRDFLSTPAPASLEAYETQLQLVIRAHLADLESFENSYTRIVPDDFTYAVLGGTVTKESVLGTVESLKEGARRARDRADDRSACKTTASACKPAEIRFPALPEPSPANGAESKIPDTAAEIHSLAYRNADPVVALASSACVPGAQGIQYFTVRTPQILGKYPTSTAYINELYFFRLSSNGRDESGIQRFLRSRGSPYLLYPPLSYYVCPLVAEDSGRVFGLINLVNFFRNQPGDSRAFPTEEVMSEGETLRHAREALSEQLPRNVREELGETALSYLLRTAGFENLAEQVAYVGTTELQMQSAGIPIDAEPVRLFTTHSGFPFLYRLPAADSGAPLSPVTTSTGRPTESRLLRWSSADEKTREDFLHAFDVFYDFHDSPATF